MLNDLLGWVVAHGLTMLYGLFIGMAILMLIWVRRIQERAFPFLDELRDGADWLHQVRDSNSYHEYQQLVGLTRISLAILSGFAILGLFTLLGALMTPSG